MLSAENTRGLVSPLPETGLRKTTGLVSEASKYLGNKTPSTS